MTGRALAGWRVRRTYGRGVHAPAARLLPLVVLLTLDGVSPGLSQNPPRARTGVVARPGAAPASSNVGDGTGPVAAEMRHVDFHIDEGIVLRIDRLRGELLASQAGGVPTLDDKSSFSLTIASGVIAIDMPSLETLLNRHAFGYAGSPLKRLKVSTENGQLLQTGTMHKGVDLPFRIRATVSLTPEGEIRLHPTAVRVVGVGVQRLMGLFGAHLDGMIKLEKGRGVRVEKDDIILDATAILPPPRIRGRLTGIRVGDGVLVQTFGPGPAKPAAALPRPDSVAPNYMYFRGGTLRFGKLTMRDADLQIVDEHPADPFDFSLDRYNDQLVAGSSRSTQALGLIVHMPDFSTLTRARGAAPGSAVRTNPKGEKK